MGGGARIAGLAVAALLALGGASALASGQTKPPHIAGSTYCETVTQPAYVLYGYVKGMSCATEKAWVTRCQSHSGLAGWRLSTDGRYGELLERGSKTMDLQIAGGSPRCLA